MGAFACAYAQKKDNKVAQPDLATADNTFFDPTRPDPNAPVYRFAVEYRLELGYNQNEQRSENFPNMFLNGAHVGATFDFLLPYHLSIQTGVLMNVVYGTNTQHSRSITTDATQEEYLHNRVTEWTMTIPVRCYYVIPLWKKLNMFFFTGPDLTIGLLQDVKVEDHLSDPTREWWGQHGAHLTDYDRYASGELYRCNVHWGLGGGLEWDMYRLQAGYDFGLNNLVKDKAASYQKMNEWGWFVTVAFRL